MSHLGQSAAKVQGSIELDSLFQTSSKAKTPPRTDRTNMIAQIN